MRLVAVLLALGLLSACAQQPQVTKLDIPYVPQRDVVAVTGAGEVQLRIIAREGRDGVHAFDATRIGLGGGAAFAAHNDISATIAAALGHELAAQGFRVADRCQSSCMTVFVTVLRFQSEFASTTESRGLVGPAIAAVALDVEVADRDGIIIYAARGEGGAVERDTLLASATSASSILATSARSALVGAFTNAVADIITDVRLRAALLTGKVPPKRDEQLDAQLPRFAG